MPNRLPTQRQTTQTELRGRVRRPAFHGDVSPNGRDIHDSAIAVSLHDFGNRFGNQKRSLQVDFAGHVPVLFRRPLNRFMP